MRYRSGGGHGARGNGTVGARCGRLPVVATRCGGPSEILESCRNGLLIDPLDTKGLGMAVHSALADRDRWQRWSRAGLSGSRQYTWTAHARRYVQAFEEAEAAGLASIQVDGYFIDYPIVDKARRVLELAAQL